jgi:hypothetical protein
MWALTPLMPKELVPAAAQLLSPPAWMGSLQEEGGGYMDIRQVQFSHVTSERMHCGPYLQGEVSAARLCNGH